MRRDRTPKRTAPTAPSDATLGAVRGGKLTNDKADSGSDKIARIDGGP